MNLYKLCKRYYDLSSFGGGGIAKITHQQIKDLIKSIYTEYRFGEFVENIKKEFIKNYNLDEENGYELNSFNHTLNIIFLPETNSIGFAHTTNVFYMTNVEAKMKNRKGQIISDKIYVKFANERLSELGLEIINKAKPALFNKVMEPNKRFAIDFMTGFG